MSVITDPNTKEKLKNAMKEASSAMTRIETEQGFIKDIIDDMKETTDIDKKVLRKLFKAYHKQNYQEEISQSEEFQNIYESVVG